MVYFRSTRQDKDMKFKAVSPTRNSANGVSLYRDQ